MAAEDLLIDDGCERQTIETIGKGFPQFNVVPSFACNSQQRNIYKAYSTNYSRFIGTKHQRTYTRHRIRKFCWYLRTHDFHEEGKNFLGTWFCKQGEDKLFLAIVFPGRRNHPRIGSCFPEESLHIQTNATSHNTDHEYRLQNNKKTITFMWNWRA